MKYTIFNSIYFIHKYIKMLTNILPIGVDNVL